MNRHLDTKLIRESFYALILALIADSIAGYIMNRYVDIFHLIPGLLMVIPALIDMRGNVYGAFISRLSSKLHLGEIKNMQDEKLKIGIYTAKTLAYSAALIVGLISGFFAYISTGNPTYILFIPAIILVTHLFTTSILTPITAYIGVKSYQKGWNPDNVGVPLISSIGDLVSVTFIIFVGYLLLLIFHIPLLILGLSIGILTYIFLIARIVFKDIEGKTVYIQSIPILLIVAIIELITGGMWEANKIALILLILPPTLETLGNIGSIYSSRLSSFIYLGFLEPTIIPRGAYFRREIISIFVLGIIVYALISIFVFFVTFDYRAILMVWISAFISLFILLLISYYLTVGSLKMKLDPDNVVVPVITTLADIIGTSSILFVYYFLF